MDLKEQLKELIRFNLINLYSKKINYARDYELYYSIAHSLRYYFSRYWLNTKEKNSRKKASYFLSFEYLPGKYLSKIAKNLGIYEDLKEAVNEMGINFDRIIALEKEPALGNGNMGINTFEIFETYANNELNAQAYGLRYRGGLFNQQIIKGSQIEEGNYWLNEENPWEHKKGFKYTVDFRDFKVYARAYDYPSCGYKNNYVNTMRLWDVEFPEGVNFDAFSRGDLSGAYYIKNKASSIVEFLYPEDSTGFGKELRIYQEYFYASASIQDILRRFFKYHGKNEFKNIEEHVEILISDIHPMFSIIEFVRILESQYNIPFDLAFNKAKLVFNYTNFGVVPESFEVWHVSHLKDICPIIIPTLRRIDYTIKEFDNTLGIIKDDRLNLFDLAIYFSRNIFTLTKNHEKKLDKIITNDNFKEKISSVDIGASHINWLKNNNEDLSNFLIGLVGDYTKDITLLKNLEEYSYDTAVLDKLYEIKLKNKKELANKIRDDLGIYINPYSVYDMQLERIHEYKRQLLNALEISYLYFRLKENPNLSIPDRTYFFSGKAPKTYQFAKEVIKFINALSYMVNKDLLIKNKIKIVFVPNIELNDLFILSKTCDIYKNISEIDKETGVGHSLHFMINGAINVATNEGALANQIEYLGEDFNKYIYTFNKNKEHRNMNLNDIYYEDDVVKFTIDNLINAKENIFPYDFNIIYKMLLQSNDYYNVIRDLEALEHTQGRVYNSYYDKYDWNRRVLRNLILSSEFSIDKTVKNIRKDI